MQRILVVGLWVAVVLSGCVHEPATVPAPTAVRETPAAISADPRVRFAEAMARVERGDDVAARPVFAELLRTYPELEDYHLANLAAIDERAGRFADSAALLDRLLDDHRESVWIARALSRRARVAAALGDPDADAYVERALAARGADDASRAAALLVRGDLRAASSPREALTLYQEVRRMPGTSASAARTRSDALIAAHPEVLDDLALLLAEGSQLVREGRLDDAVARLETAARTAADASQRAAALRELARARQRQGRLADAIESYRAAAAVEPAPAVLARYELATLLWNRDRDSEAAALFTRVLRDAPGSGKADGARYALGRIAEQTGRAADAAAEYRRLIASGSDAALVREARWRIAWQAYDGGRLVDAIAAFANVAAASPADHAGALYWQGRTRERRDGAGAGDDLYRAVVAQVPESYYADLSEARLHETAPAPPAPEPIAGPPPTSLVERTYHWNRSRELHAVALDTAAARELAAIADEPGLASDAESFLMEAYREVDAHDRALRLATRLGTSDGVARVTLAAYLYPRAYWTLISDAADAEHVDPLLVLAVIRQESLFAPDAVSPAAAYGLMQLIVPTAEQLAGATVTATDLIDPRRNVDLGTRYLRRLLDRYDGDVPKALAAYNGGEDAVAKWEARAPGSPSDEFVERISFRETRTYVKMVLGNYRHYRRLYGAPGERRALPPDARGDAAG